ncbi:serine hydrolase domain-containing protein [Pseudolysinimonas sp.]|uniref:serine hydrolase domain-containing protein n=1 Tax=Pseudolysinimonas sp. TaxID=2680009 RepID=UPI003784F507
MHSSRLVSGAVIAASALVLVGCAATPPQLGIGPRAHSTTTIDKRTLESDAALTRLIADDRPGCSGAVGIRGDVVWAGATGLADLTAGTPVTTATRFDMASVSKQFTATAILMLQRDGALSLSDPVSTYVDGLPRWGTTVTLDALMHHTARVPDYWTVLDDDGIGFSDPADHGTILQAIRRLPRLSAGSGYEYSNSNYVLLAEVVARVSGMPLPQFLDERIFTPLGLDMVLAPSLVAPDVALSYDDAENFQPPGWTAYGAIGIFTTPAELVRWGDQYRDGDVIQDDFAVGAADEGTGEFYAAGMDIEVDGDLNHNGRFGGYTSTFTISADRETTIAVMCNGHAADRFGLDAALWEIWDPAEAATPAPTEEVAP